MEFFLLHFSLSWPYTVIWPYTIIKFPLIYLYVYSGLYLPLLGTLTMGTLKIKRLCFFHWLLMSGYLHYVICWSLGIYFRDDYMTQLTWEKLFHESLWSLANKPTLSTFWVALPNKQSDRGSQTHLSQHLLSKKINSYELCVIHSSQHIELLPFTS